MRQGSRKTIADILLNCGQLGPNPTVGPVRTHVEYVTELYLRSRGGGVAPGANLYSWAHPTLTPWVFPWCSISEPASFCKEKHRDRKDESFSQPKRWDTSRNCGNSLPQMELNCVMDQRHVVKSPRIVCYTAY